jgi:hypothetical protein
MSLFCCDRNNNCVGIAVVASIILGIVAAFLQLTAAITVTPAFLWVVFGIAIVYLAVTLIAAALMHGTPLTGCVCTVLSALLVGILGTVLLSVILLAITFAATSIIGAIIVGGLVLFFALTVSATACLVRCLMHCN